MIRYLLHPIRSMRRLAELEERLEHLQVNLTSDQQWLAHDEVSRILTLRYLRMASDHWRLFPHCSSGDLRCRLGLNPWAKQKPEPPLPPPTRTERGGR